MTSAAEYTGRRILEAMHEAVLYSKTIMGLIETSMPLGAKHILEFGAGDGVFVRAFRALDIKVDCVEIDAELRNLLTGVGGRVYADIRDVESASYDFVYTVNVLEHIHALDRVISDLRRVLKPAGTLFVFVPAFNVLWTSLDDEVGHVQRFTRKSLVVPLETAGFHIKRMEYFDSLGFAAALAIRALEKLNLFHYEGKTVGFYDRHLFPISRRMDSVFNSVAGKNLVGVATRS
jgi:SAM-dependent methyltransferase